MIRQSPPGSVKVSTPNSSLLRGHASQKAEEHFFDQLLIVLDLHAANLTRSFAGSLAAFASEGPLTSFMTGPRATPLDLSHSQALSRTGRPEVV